MGMFVTGRELIDVALGIERNGAAFYESLADSTKGLTAGNIYKYLAAKEREHFEIFQGMLGLLGEYHLPEDYSEEYDHYLRSLVDSSVFTDDQVAREMARKVSNDAEAIQIAIGAEKDSILFYSEIKELVRRADLDVVSEIIQEERSHLRQLLDLKEKLDS